MSYVEENLFWKFLLSVQAMHCQNERERFHHRKVIYVYIYIYI